ncbi:hypothetical protein [Ralstonia sp.]|uniref:DUF6948 domain-containing protein n=1 Tax=Ralstonia sp. TaxID=54061 RepID=UPI0025804D7F|nr:hypothetical protein [Ralstonia sp.]MBA4282626.1 hypothetical protein [Ralstonia sp.]
MTSKTSKRATKSTAKKAAPKTAKAIPVVVCTDKRGVVFGYTSKPNARPIVLTNARMCLYWSAKVGGVFGLADIGPDAASKISATAPSITLEGVTAVFGMTPAAVAAWNAARVQGR